MNTNLFQNLRVLIVEDDQPTAQALCLDFEEAQPGIKIDTAASVAAASKLLAQARENRFNYDAAILDFRIPQSHQGETTAPDFAVRSELLERSPGTIIIQVSAFGSDVDIQCFQERRRDLPDDYPAFIPKTGDWTLQVFDALERGVHSRRIRRRLEELSGAMVEPPGEAGAAYLFHRQGAGGGQSVGTDLTSGAARSLAIADLCADASQHWVRLGSELQAKLKDNFGFAEVDGFVYVGAAPEECDNEDADLRAERPAHLLEGTGTAASEHAGVAAPLPTASHP